MNLLTENGERVRNFYRKQGADAERERIIALLQQALDSHTKVLQLRPDRSDSDHRHTICRTYQSAIALIKGENK